MTNTKIKRQSIWRLPGLAQFAILWRRLTEPPADFTEPRDRQQSRLIAILCLSGFLGGLVGVTISDYGHDPDLRLLENPSLVVSIICDALVFLAYFLGRRRKTLNLASLMLVGIVVGGIFISIITDPADYDTLVIYLVVGQVFASLLLSSWGTRISLVLTFAGLALLPVISPTISIPTVLRSLGPIFVVSIVTAIGVTVRRRDQRTIEHQARQLADAKQQAESANQLKGVFLGMVSHELRTPLNNILGYSDQMLMGLTGSLSGEAIEAAERIHRNGENLGRMIADLLILSRLESDSLTIVRRPFRLDELLAEVNRSFRERSEARGLAFTTTIDDALPEVIVGDPQRIEQIVLNLVSNAVKFTDHGEISVRFSRSGPDEWSAEVSDTGIGLTEDAIPRIFDRFYQVDSTSRRSYGGAGLGLAIARELAILMGGSISLKTAVNAGSTFTMNLPLTTDETDLHAVQSGNIVTAA